MSGLLLTLAFVASVFGPFERSLYAATAICLAMFVTILTTEHLVELRRRRKRALQRRPRPPVTVLRERYASF